MAKEASEELVTKKDLGATKKDLLHKLASKTSVDRLHIEVGKNAEAIDRLAIQVSKNTQSIGRMVTREEFNERMNQIANGQDKMMVILDRLDKERTFTTEWVKRIEAELEKSKKKIASIKSFLKIA